MPQAPNLKAKGPLAVVFGSATLAAAFLGLIQSEEGYSAKPYRDVAGIWTACYGDTENIDPKRTYTKAECDTRLERQAVRHVKGVLRCTPHLTDYQLIAAGSLAYNIGEGAYCKSTVARLFNEGKSDAACRGFNAWNKARVRERLTVVKGLQTRRTKESNICLGKDTLNVRV